MPSNIKKLIGGLRYCAQYDYCSQECPYHDLCDDQDTMLNTVADLIEKLASNRGPRLGWINAKKLLPKESGKVLVGIVNRDRTEFVHITNANYSAIHRAFNTYDWMDVDEAAKVKFNNRECYWMPMPGVPSK